MVQTDRVILLVGLDFTRDGTVTQLGTVFRSFGVMK